MNYASNLAKFKIVSKDGQSVPFEVNKFQEDFINSMTGKDIILKARQIGFSSVVLGVFTLDFLLKENSRSVCISHDASSAQKLLDRVKYFITSAQEEGLAVDLKYNSRNELVNAEKNSSFYIGASGSKSFGRGDTLHNLLLSEIAFYDDPESMLASSLQALVPNGKVVLESTANGMNFFKEYWDKSKAGNTGFKTHFFDRTFYSEEFLKQKSMELGDDLFMQEYPLNDVECFLSSGNSFFPKESLKEYLNKVSSPIGEFNTYYDLPLS